MKLIMNLLVLLLLGCGGILYAESDSSLKNARKEQKNGNFKDAFNIYRESLIKGEKLDAPGTVYSKAVECLERLGEVAQFDQFSADVLARYPDNPVMLTAVAKGYLRIDHSGFLIGGEFIRGYYSGGGESVATSERDRITALRLLVKALEIVSGANSADKKNVELYLTLGQALQDSRGGSDSYKLQYLTNLSVMPPYTRMFGNFMMGRMNVIGAPVDSDGKPVYYRIPAGWNSAANDGERWRWSLQMAEKCGYEAAQFDFAQFLYREFGVQTAAWLTNRNDNSAAFDDGPFALYKLTDDETIAGLANGIKKIKMPAEYNYIKIFQKIAESNSPFAASSMSMLAQIYQSRMQYDRAAEYYRKLLTRFGEDKNKSYTRSLEQITGNLGSFKETGVFASGEKPVLYLQYRNAPAVDITVRRINVELFVKDIKEALRRGTMDKSLEACNYSPDEIGNCLINRNGGKYLLENAAAFNEKLSPDPRHWDSVSPITVPVTAAGAYLVKAALPGGNNPMQVLWVADAAIIGKTSGNTRFYAVLDAVTGKSLPAKLSFFGVQREYVTDKEEMKRLGSRYRISLHEFDVETDYRGFYLMDSTKLRQNHQYLVTARSADGKMAVQNYSWFYKYGNETDSDAKRKLFCITDCPVYRPGQKVSFKYWIRNAEYERNVQEWPGKKCTVTVNSPRGQKVFEQSMVIDQNGAIDGSFTLPVGAELGAYYVATVEYGGGVSFKVEEYVKPEYEIDLSVPEKMTKTGDPLTFRLNVAYYFGAPVVQAKVRYKVTRYFLPDTLFPPTPWRWLYGDDSKRATNGRNYIRNGIPCPTDGIPEMVMSGEALTDKSGNLELSLDTAAVKALYGNVDCRYVVTAEAEDSSGHTVYATKSLITAGKPFKVFCWTENGYYRTDDSVALNVQAFTADNKNVTGAAVIKITRNNVDKNGKISEYTVKEAKLNLDGTGAFKFKTGDAGLYRVNCDVTDITGNTIRGKCQVRVFGEKIVDENYAFQPLEILTNKSEYQAGDSADMVIGAGNKDATVLLFSRVEQNKDAAMPELLEVRDHVVKSSINIRNADMPNVFVEAWMVANGKIYNEVKQLLVPPEKKVLNITVVPSEKTFKPGQKAGLKIKVTDFSGKPVAANLAITGYDKAIEYISGGSNVPDINTFFWSWIRYFYPNYQSNLNSKFYNLYASDDKRMQPLNGFGYAFSGRGKRQSLGVVYKGSAMAAMSPGSAGNGADGQQADRMAELSSAPAPASEDSAVTTVRKNFADSLLWMADVKTGASGEAEIFVNLPDNLTAWKIRAWGIGADVNVGQGEAELAVSKNFLIRLIIPRFLTEDDEATITGIVHNYMKTSELATVSLRLEGEAIRSIDTADREVNVFPDGQAVCEWRVRAFKNGNAAIEVNAAGKAASDAVRLDIPVLLHGQEKQISSSGCLTDDEHSKIFITLNIPDERIPESALLSVKCSSSIASAIVEALPYLAGFNGNDTIGITSRFASAATADAALKKFGIVLADIKPRRMVSNENSEFPAAPVTDPAKLQTIIQTSLEKIAIMQNVDGGWGWFSGTSETSWPDTTATVVQGLIQAKKSGLIIDENVISRGVAWLRAWQNNSLLRYRRADEKKQPLSVSNIDATVLYALIQCGERNQAMTDLIYARRDNLSLSALALLGMSMKELNDSERLKMILTNLKQYLFENTENQTAYLKLPGNNCWWNWYGDEIVTQAYYLKLLTACSPRDNITRGLARYLATNRRNAVYWHSIRDTALCVDALAGYFVASGEDNAKMNAEIYFDGQLRKKGALPAGKTMQEDFELQIAGSELRSGKHTIEIRREGSGNLYYNTALSYFSLEKFITASGSEVKIDRRYYRVTEELAGRPAPGIGGSPQIQNAPVFKKTAIRENEHIKPGDIIEIELIVDAANDYEYLELTDYKVPGFEPQQILSGYSYGNHGAYVEYRNNTVKFYLRSLQRGRYALTYRVKVEIQGIFSAIPATVRAVYSPQLKSNSNENKFIIGQ